MKRRKYLNLIPITLLSGCLGVEGGDGGVLEIGLTKPIPEEVPVTPVEETDLLSFEPAAEGLREASRKRDEVIEEQYDPEEYSEERPWHYSVVGEPLDGEILREIQDELESHPEYDPESVRRAERYFRYEGEPYAIGVVMEE